MKTVCSERVVSEEGIMVVDLYELVWPGATIRSQISKLNGGNLIKHDDVGDY